jgi:FtsP/CotA-like multicopper oxidase with cupredoxin domain
MGDMGGHGDMFMRMGNMLMGADSDLLGGDAGDVYYPHYLINGKPAADPAQFTGTPGTRVRIRLINAGGDTAFRVAIGGHRLTVTHTDGFPVDPVAADSVLVGMGERYDVIVTLGDGAFPWWRRPKASGNAASPSSAPAADRRPPRTRTSPNWAKAASSRWRACSSPHPRSPSTVVTWTAPSTSPSPAAWPITTGVQRHPVRHAQPVARRARTGRGERVRLRVTNDTDMWHPFHLHGHTYQHAGGGPRKDTSIVLPNQTLDLEFDADNPGQWMTHCHNIYHGEAGMMTVLAYRP